MPPRPFVYISVRLRPSRNSLRVRATPQACKQTFLSQQVPVAQTHPSEQSALVLQSGRGSQDSLGPQNPVPSAVSKQKQSEPQLLRLSHVDPSHTGAEHWAFWQIPEGHYKGVTRRHHETSKSTYHNATSAAIVRITQGVLTWPAIAGDGSRGAISFWTSVAHFEEEISRSSAA